MARAYRLGKRAVTAAATHQRIIDSAREVIATAGIAKADLGTIARRAGVTRTTVYQQFGSREEVFLAVVNDALDRADVRTVRKALQHRDAATATRQMLRASTRFWAGEYELFSKVKGYAGIDEAARLVDLNKEEVRRGHIANLAHRLAEQGKLRPGVSEERAMQIIHLLTSYETFDHLHRQAGMRVEAVGSMIIEIVDRAVLGEPPDA
jgi:AcrR family transcriptional regulator